MRLLIFFITLNLYASCKDEDNCPKCCRDKYLVMNEIVKVYNNKYNLCSDSELEFNKKVLSALKKRDFNKAYVASIDSEIYRSLCKSNKKTTTWECIKKECR